MAAWGGKGLFGLWGGSCYAYPLRASFRAFQNSRFMNQAKP